MNGSHPVADLQWVENVLNRLLLDLVRTRCMIDVGAHVGTTLAPFLEAGWQVFAFEPVEANREQLAARFLGARNLTVRPEAVSSRTAKLAFHLALNLDGSLHEYHHSLERIADDPWHRKGPVVEVQAVRLNDLASRGELPRRVGFLKVDTEGHDLAVLRGGTDLDCEVISVEFWNDGHALGKSPSPAPEMVRQLRQRGYESYVVVCHHDDATLALYSTLRGTRPDSWGNIVFFGRSSQDAYRRLERHPEWQAALAVTRTCDDLRAQLRAKEAVIQELVRAAEERRQLIAEMLEESHTLREAAEERLRTLTWLDGEARKLAEKASGGVGARVRRLWRRLRRTG